MKIIIREEIADRILNQVRKYSPNETKGALFAHKIDDNTFEIEDVYFEKRIGSFVFVSLENSLRYKKFQKEYDRKHHYDYRNHNYIGDWHSHPSFALFPSGYDSNEVVDELKESNANFLIQIIVQEKENKLIGNCFLYNSSVTAKQIELEIQN